MNSSPKIADRIVPDTWTPQANDVYGDVCVVPLSSGSRLLRDRPS